MSEPQPQPCTRCLGSGLTPILPWVFAPASLALLLAGAWRDAEGNPWMVCPRCDGAKVLPPPAEPE